MLPSLGLKRLECNRLFPFLPRPARAFAVKEIKTFFRDKSQWSQIFLVVGLIAIYLYNFSVFPLEKGMLKMEYLQNLLSFLNMALAAFVLTAVSARFVFPAVSIEGDAFWIVKSSPVTLRGFLWIKFLVYFLPLLFLSELLARGDEPDSSCNPFHDGPLRCDHSLHGPRHCLHGSGPWCSLSRLSVREPGTVCHQLRWSDLHDRCALASLPR